MYDSVASEGAPEDFLKLLDAADRKSAGGEGGDSDKGKTDSDFLDALNEAEKSSKKD